MYSIFFGGDDEVAKYIEDKYGIVHSFIDKHMDGVIGDFIKARNVDDAYHDTSAIAESLKDYIRQEKTGIVTNTSIIGTTRERVGKLGRGKRLQNRPNRPSFIESGVYVDNLEVWTNDSK